jgi:hypothetical protein
VAVGHTIEWDSPSGNMPIATSTAIRLVKPTTARLIPVSGIRNAEEQERRATSALLAVLSAVDEFNLAITKPFGAVNQLALATVEGNFS